MHVNYLSTYLTRGANISFSKQYSQELSNFRLKPIRVRKKCRKQEKVPQRYLFIYLHIYSGTPAQGLSLGAAQTAVMNPISLCNDG